MGELDMVIHVVIGLHILSVPFIYPTINTQTV